MISIILSIFLILGLLLLIYGIYLLAVMKNDLTNNKLIPAFVKKNMKTYGIMYVLVGIILVSGCGFGIKKYGFIDNSVVKSNFGFRFY